MEFKPEKDRIILRHLIVKHSGDESIITDSEWDKFDKIIQSQIKKLNILIILIQIKLNCIP